MSTKYENIFCETIAEGTFAIVYKTFENGKFYTIKMLKEKNLEFYEKELEILGIFKNHDYVVKLIGGEIIQDQYAIRMEWIEGESLFGLVCETDLKYFLPKSTVKKIFLEMSKGLEYIHSQGIIHGDIKIENIIVEMNQGIKAKWIDFGLSEKVKDINYPLTNNFVGSREYIAPEKYSSHLLTYGDEDDECFEYDGFISDTWSLIVCLYLMITKSFPFDCEDVIVYFKMTKEHPPFDSQKDFLTIQSNDLKNLFKDSFILNPLKRLSLKEIINHKWLNTNNNTLNDDISYIPQHIISNLKKMNFRNSI